MKAFEVLHIPVAEWVFVVPFDLKRDCSASSVRQIEYLHMIHFVRDRLAWHIVDAPLDGEGLGSPAFRLEPTPEPLCPFGFPAAASDDLLNGDGRRKQDVFKFLLHLRKVTTQDRLGVTMKVHLEACSLELFKHAGNLAIARERST